MLRGTTGGGGPLGREAVLVPVKAFGRAKGRLSGVLTEDGRRRLAMAMAEHVLEAARPLAVAVVCDDREVADWARRLGALVIWEPGRGLNGAVEAGVGHLATMGVERAIVAHADLPLPEGLGGIARFEGVTLVPDHRDDGTNVIGLPTRCSFRFSYGPGSFDRHRSACQSSGVDWRIVRHPELALDIDSPTDLWADPRWAHLIAEVLPLPSKRDER